MGEVENLDQAVDPAHGPALSGQALVAIHLREKNAERTWETFCGGPVDMRLWDKVAAVRGMTHPEEGIMLLAAFD